MARLITAPAWRRAFLRELARSGSVALAADKAGIERTTPYQLRRRNPAFATSWERALATARVGLVEGSAPDLRDDQIVRASKAGKPCVMRAGPGRWSTASERAFLAALTASANVKAAARAAGVSTVAAYNRRRQWPAFAAAWDAAKEEGWVQLEMMLIYAANATLDPEPEVDAARAEAFAGPDMTVEQAMKLWFHRADRERGKAPRYGWRRREPDIEEVRAELLRKVAAMDKAKRVRG